MKIAYCTNVRLPNERAHGHQVARVCGAMQELGHDVTIFAPFRYNPVTERFSSFHTVSHEIQLKHLGTFDPIASPFLPGVLGLWTLNWMLRKNLKKELHDFDIVYTRSPSILQTLVDSKIPTVLELHSIPRRNRSLFIKLCNQCALVVALTGPMANELRELGVRTKIIVEGDAVDYDFFASAQSSMNSEKPNIVYAGQLESMGLSKGIPELLGALDILAQKGISFNAQIAGGPEVTKSRFISMVSPEIYNYVSFLGRLDHDEIPELLESASVLVYPAPASNHPFYLRDTSPLKLFEYAASGKPIVSADLPPIRDVFDESMLTFFQPGDVKGLALAIEKVLSNTQEALEKAKKAQWTVQEHTWEKRMQRILSSLS